MARISSVDDPALGLDEFLHLCGISVQIVWNVTRRCVLTPAFALLTAKLPADSIQKLSWWLLRKRLQNVSIKMFYQKKLELFACIFE